MACIIAMIAFWMVEARNYIKRDEVVQLIESQSPYAKDKSLIMAELNRANDSNKALEQTVSQMKDVLMDLKIEIAVLNKTLQGIREEEQNTGAKFLQRQQTTGLTAGMP